MTMCPRAAIALSLPLVLVMGLWSCGRREPGAGPAAEALSFSPAAASIELAAAASLAELAQDLAAGWEERSGMAVRVRLAASSTLARQIRAGCGAHLFLSASADWVDDLDVVARRAWLGNRLALVARGGAGLSSGDTRAQLAELDSLVLAEPGVPLGRAAEAALSSMGVALPARVMRGAHARDVLSKVSQGAARAGIVYVTDAALDDEVEVLAVLPGDSHPAIRYEAALLDPVARGMFDALGEPWVLELAARHGFSSDGLGDP